MDRQQHETRKGAEKMRKPMFLPLRSVAVQHQKNPSFFNCFGSAPSTSNEEKLLPFFRFFFGGSRYLY
jgi:hypothetical protein